MAREELLIRLSMFEEQARELGERIRIIDNQIGEMENLNLSLVRMEKSRGKEMLAPLGRGIFLKTDVKDEKVFVNVGSKILVRKSLSEAADIVKGQIRELETARIHFMASLEQVNDSLSRLIEEANKEEK